MSEEKEPDASCNTERSKLDWRGIPEDEACSCCQGSGLRTYPNTSTWVGGIGGQMLTDDVCDKCWGSGNEKRPWLNLRELRNNTRRAERSQLLPLDEQKVLDSLDSGSTSTTKRIVHKICQTFSQPKDAMSVPTVDEINKVLLESPRHKYNYETKEYDTQAQAIHELITRKLKGLDNGKTI